MPIFGLGVALTGESTYDSVKHAISLGYSLFDTAAEESYGNEDQVGRAVSEYYTSKNSQSDINRKLFVTTKLWDTDHGFYNTLKAFFQSHQQINNKFSKEQEEKSDDATAAAAAAVDSVVAIDLYLIHSPYGGKLLETWDALLWLQHHNFVKSIGVSNFGIEHLEVLRKAQRPMPVVNQIEMHPLVFAQRRDLLDYCQQHSIAIQAFGSLMHGYSHVLEHPLLNEMVQHYNTNGMDYDTYPQPPKQEQQQESSDYSGVQVAHILLQWALQHGFAIIPKSSKVHRITNNAKYFNLLQQQQKAKDASELVEFVLSSKSMEALDQWGTHLSYHDRNIYKQDWNWNPIDEAPLHIGREDYWTTNYQEINPFAASSMEQQQQQQRNPKNGVAMADLEEFLKTIPDDSIDEDEYWEEYWQNGIPLNGDDDDDYDDGNEEEDEDEEFHQEL